MITGIEKKLIDVLCESCERKRQIIGYASDTISLIRQDLKDSPEYIIRQMFKQHIVSFEDALKELDDE